MGRGSRMPMSEELRVSDGERDRVVEFLKDQTAQGRLNLEELEQRTGAAYAAKTRLQLQRLTTRTIRCAVGCRDKWAAARFRGPLVRSAPLRSRPNSVACGRCARHTHELILRPV